MPSTMITTPDMKAVCLQPSSVRDQAIAGTSSPPIPKPLMAMPIATPRRLSNQLTTVVATVRKPPTLDPRAIRRKAT